MPSKDLKGLSGAILQRAVVPNGLLGTADGKLAEGALWCPREEYSPLGAVRCTYWEGSGSGLAGGPDVG